MTTLCLDARLFGVTHTGIGRYTEELIRHLPSSSDIRLVFIRHPQVSSPLLDKYESLPARHHPYSLASQFEMANLLSRLRPDLLHVPHFTLPVFWPGRTIITLHDLIKHKSRGPATTTHHPLTYWPKYLGYRLLVNYALSRSVHIITPSNYWRDELVTHFHLPSQKISVIYEGVDAQFFSSPPKSAPGNYLVYTGNVYPHKNLPVLIAAAQQLNLPLKIVCARNVFAQRLPSSPLIEFLGQLSDSEVKQLYSNAIAFVFPSLFEGFGLPGLEAMAAGLPVIAARASCLPEIYQAAALYFDPHSVSDLVKQINHLRQDPQLRQTLIKRGQLLAKTYTWTKMAQHTWEVYQHELP